MGETPKTASLRFLALRLAPQSLKIQPITNSLLQTIAPLAQDKVQTPVLAMGGAGSLGATVAEQMRQVAQNVEESVID